jgi:hypothetical protein
MTTRMRAAFPNPIGLNPTGQRALNQLRFERSVAVRSDGIGAVEHVIDTGELEHLTHLATLGPADEEGDPLCVRTPLRVQQRSNPAGVDERQLREIYDDLSQAVCAKHPHYRIELIATGHVELAGQPYDNSVRAVSIVMYLERLSLAELHRSEYLDWLSSSPRF